MRALNRIHRPSTFGTGRHRRYPVRVLAALLFSLGAYAAAVPAAEIAKSDYDPRKLSYPSLPDFQPPEGRRVQLDNGLTVLLIEDHELPQVQALARVGGGKVEQPPELWGLASMTAEVMRSGGAGERGPDELNELLEGLGASVETSVSDTHASVFMSTLSDSTDRVLEVFADVLREPRFAQEKVDLAKSQAKSEISRRNDQPQQIAFRELMKLVYGPDSPYARHTEYYTVDRVQRESMVSFHRTHFHPANTLISVWGDFDSDEMLAKLREELGDWPQAEDFEPQPPPQPNAPREASVNLIEKTDINQSTIVVGHPGEIKRSHPDYPAVQVMNQVLSGGFTGRLFKNVRSNMGLAYSVFGRYSAGYRRTGVFLAGVFTKSGTTVKATRAVLDEIERMRQAPPGEEELKLAKDAFLNSFVFRLDSLREVLGRRMTYEMAGYPDDFLQSLKRRIQDVTADDVHRVAEKYLHPDAAHILVVGKPDAFSQDLAELGDVNRIDISIPTSAPGEKASVSEADRSKGRTLLNEAREALGGDAFADIEAVRSRATQTLHTPRGSLDVGTDTLIVFPDRLLLTQELPMGTSTLVIDGNQGVAKTAQGRRELPASMRNRLRGSLWRSLVYLFSHLDADGLEVAAEGSETVKGERLSAVRVEPPQTEPFTLLLSPDTHRPQRIRYQGRTMQGSPVESTDVLSDYRAVDGIELPFSTVTYQQSEKAVEASLESVTLNPDYDAARFDVGTGDEDAQSE